MTRCYLGTKKLERCRRIGLKNYTSASVRGGERHFLAICAYTDPKTGLEGWDAVDYKNNIFFCRGRDGKQIYFTYPRPYPTYEEWKENLGKYITAEDIAAIKFRDETYNQMLMIMEPAIREMFQESARLWNELTKETRTITNTPRGVRLILWEEEKNDGK